MSQSEVEGFLAWLFSSVEAQMAIARVGNDPHDVAAFARQSGYAVSADEMEHHIAEQLDAQLSPEQKVARGEAFERAAGPVFSSRTRSWQVETRDATCGFTLAREPVLAGDFVIVSGSAAFQTLARRIRHTLAQAFADADVTTAHADLDEPAYHACVQSAGQSLADDPAVPHMVADLVESLGGDARRVASYGPYIRYNLPAVDTGVQGYFAKVPVRVTSRLDPSDGESALLNAHRDTWFGAPFHQLNFWAPLYPHPPGSGLVLLPRLFTKSLRNNTAGFDVWRAQLGLAVGPMCLEQIDDQDRFHPDLETDEFIVFSANHFHGTGLNVGSTARVSMELRLVCEDDRQNGVSAPNVDFHGAGELSYARIVSADDSSGSFE